MNSRGFEYTSVVNYVYSLASMHNYNNLPSPPIKHFSVNQALAGLRRDREDKPNKKLPILIDHLMIIHRGLQHLPKRARTAFWAACLTAFFSLLRRSNLFFAKNQKSFLKVRNFICKDGQYYLSAKQIKTTKFKAGTVELPVSLITGSQLCPTATLQAQVKLMLGHEDEPLFAYKSHSAKI